jgi:hypothetical protein
MSALAKRFSSPLKCSRCSIRDDTLRAERYFRLDSRQTGSNARIEFSRTLPHSPMRSQHNFGVILVISF